VHQHREVVNGRELGFLTAFLAGGASFASPCVLPLVPAYLSFLAGVSYSDLVDSRDPATMRRVIVAAAAFVLGFIAVFVALGASATVIGRVLTDHADVFSKIGGVLIVVFGLQYTGLLRIPALLRDVRFHPGSLAGSPLGAFAMGLAFAFGWTPCVGPLLGSILALAASSRSVTTGVVLLAFYGLGIGLPFLLAAFAVRPFLRVMRRLREKMRAIELSVGIVMIATGILIFTGSLSAVSGRLLESFPALGHLG